jgi:hypothetical protein
MARSRSMHAAMAQSVEPTGAEGTAGTEIPLPGLDRVQSAAAVPLVVHGALAGVLYLESDRPGEFGPGDERLLRILGGHLAATLAVLQADHRESAPSSPPPTPTLSHERTSSVVYYQSDDSVLVDDAYVVKGVPGRILWKLVCEHAADGRVAFTNRELRLDERLGLPAGNDNLEARLLVLRKRLALMDCGVGLERVGRGQLALSLKAPIELFEVATSGPMRAAHVSSDAE